MSEVVRLHQQIEQECEAIKQALQAPTIVASYDVSSHKYDAIQEAKDERVHHIGGVASTEEMVNMYQKVVG